MKKLKLTKIHHNTFFNEMLISYFFLKKLGVLNQYKTIITEPLQENFN